jgi:hypothetical protein
MLIVGGSLSVGSHDPDCGTWMPSGAVHPIWGIGNGGLSTTRPRRDLRLSK